MSSEVFTSWGPPKGRPFMGVLESNCSLWGAGKSGHGHETGEPQGFSRVDAGHLGAAASGGTEPGSPITSQRPP